MAEATPRYKVWYIPQVPMRAFEREYEDRATAVAVYEALIEFSAFEFENRVKPDYSDAGGVAVWDGDDWEDLDDDELESDRG